LKSLHSTIVGDSGKDLLILHGFLGMSDNWKTHAKNWAQSGYRVHLIDQRNHGRSFWSPEFSYELMSDDIAHYCQTNSLSNLRILGHSMGGKTAMHFACKYPHYLNSFVVADIAPKKYNPHHQKILQGLSELDFNQIKTRNQADEFLSDYVSEPGVRMFLLKNLYWEKPGRLGLRLNIEVLKDASEEIGKNLIETSQSSIPCLFVKGELSSYILDTDTLSIKHYFPNSELITIPGAGHWLHAEKPTLFFDQVTQWFARQI
jgi:esterase